jgi:hypothetical protein
MALPIAELRGMSTERLIEYHDQSFGGMTETSTSFRDELARRDQEVQAKVLLKMTRWITIMTGIMTIATIVNIVLFALSA